ncbi:cytochrome b/b6 domain-containing protein [Sphingomonas sp. G124]|uniref:Cytochrome b/b6 domain-containing protein n=1 Tax=Sphingomonas cremea TaxID=2904799 RepID=A0A9X1TXT2_9SPHN|nr:cytochrome b/b6 domain-containing protein [Sphingomonas cremea]MCF2515530.1 cytochrome b/b6 domain-containing protein [Sphingomonas cremea]
MSDYMITESSGPVAMRYRKIVMWIHWITAILLIMQVYIGFTFQDLPRGTPERAFVFGWHKTWGVMILLLAVARLAVRLMNPPPPFPSDYPKWRRLIAVWNHRLFYLLLIGIPLTGLAAVSGRAEGGWVPLQLGLSVPAIPGIPKENEFNEVHELLIWAVLALLALHVTAALYNQFVYRGSVAGRMWPFKSVREA